MPLWLLYVLTVLAVYRVSRLAAKDDFPPVLWLRDRLAGGRNGGWRPLTRAEREDISDAALNEAQSQVDFGNGPEAARYVRRAAWSPAWLADLLTCPWCVSGWVSGTATLWLDLDRGVPQPVIFGFAVWAGAALIGSRSWA